MVNAVVENIADNITAELPVFLNSPADTTTEIIKTDGFESVTVTDVSSSPDIDTTWMDISDVFDKWITCLIGTEHRICAPGKSLIGDLIKQIIDDMLENGLIDCM